MRSDKPWVVFECEDCQEEFQCRYANDDPLPECPMCWRKEREENRFEDMLESQVPPAVSKNGMHGADITYKMMEREYGITDLKDNLREGDVAYKADAPRPTAEENKLIKAELDLMTARATAQPTGPVPIQSNWGAQPRSMGNAGEHIQKAQQYTAAAKQEGTDTFAIMDQMKRAAPRPRFNVMARADKSGNVVTPVRRKGA